MISQEKYRSFVNTDAKVSKIILSNTTIYKNNCSSQPNGIYSRNVMLVNFKLKNKKISEIKFKF
jgi:hypothetical protein